MNEQDGQGVLDEEVIRAIYEVVESENESKKVAKRLIAWLGELSLGRTSLGEGETAQYFDTIRNVLSEGDES